MGTAVACVYTFTPTTVSDGTLQTMVSSIFLDFTLPNFYGYFLDNDQTTTSGGSVIRTIDWSLVPTANATATTALVAGDPSGSPVQSVTVTAPGSLYAAPPIVTFNGNSQRPARGVATMAVGGFNIVEGGSGYTSPVVNFIGGELAPGGIPVTATATLGGGGSIASVAVTNPVNGPYLTAPLVFITDGAGSGAYIIAGLSVSGVTLTDPGFGYIAAPTVTFTPLSKVMVPDSSGLVAQAAPLQGFMQGIFENALKMVAPSTAVAS
jgi:hypothetical protein